MIDVGGAGEVVSVEGDSPAIPEDVEVAIGDADATAMGVVGGREWMLCGGASAGDQCICVEGILREHGVHQATDILPNACSLPDASRIVKRNTHVKKSLQPST